jgi:hypothetical protein
MTTALTPAQALGYLNALSTDIRAAAVLDPAGELLAGAPDLAPDADGNLTARDAHHTIVVATRPHAACAVLEIDLQSALSAMTPAA